MFPFGPDYYGQRPSPSSHPEKPRLGRYQFTIARMMMCMACVALGLSLPPLLFHTPGAPFALVTIFSLLGGAIGAMVNGAEGMFRGLLLPIVFLAAAFAVTIVLIALATIHS